MKKIFILAIATVMGIATVKVNAQNVNINVSMQPAWAPVGNVTTAFYYIPEINVYFDVVRNQFIYPQGNKWVYVRQLPPAYNRYNLDVLYKVPLKRNGAPYAMNARDRRDYAKFASTRYHNRQVILRNAPHDRRDMAHNGGRRNVRGKDHLRH